MQRRFMTRWWAIILALGVAISVPSVTVADGTLISPIIEPDGGGGSSGDPDAPDGTGGKFASRYLGADRGAMRMGAGTVGDGAVRADWMWRLQVAVYVLKGWTFRY